MKILVVSPAPTHPTTAGNRARVLSICNVLIEAGHNVHFAWAPQHETNPDEMPNFFKGNFTQLRSSAFPPHKRTFRNITRKLMQRAGIERAFVWPIDSWYNPELTEQLASLHSREQFDAVLLNYVFYSRAFEAFGASTLKILETHDRFSDRHKLLKKAGMKSEWFSTSQDQEAEGLRRADVIVAIQEHEADYFRRIAPEKNVVVVHPIAENPSTLPFSNKRNAVVVGSSNSPNLKGVEYLIKEVAPLVRQRIPDFEIILAGDISNHFQGLEGVVNLGRVRKIADAYQMASIAINPVLTGTGFCIKSLEALGYGMPLVSTEAGLRGMEMIQGNYVFRAPNNEPVTFSDRICEALSTPDREALGRDACDAAIRWSEMQKSTLLAALKVRSKNADSIANA